MNEIIEPTCHLIKDAFWIDMKNNTCGEKQLSEPNLYYTYDRLKSGV